ncbi:MULTISPECIES: 4,5-DOPA dioxygenase extradiol [Flavobacteriaceae]|uniref:4,5-DOPA-extradiol-dioxygenase n=1 Tax=Flavobacteriaceae TaxID=49546 RepID=UPI001C0F1310|nr:MULTISPECIES: 4,5-DOPA dioxygenase extradiol [Allomuricauda]MDC6364646.1 4,5-DOPA dioxygenase extradiol [Muricauda sp. AC10]
MAHLNKLDRFTDSFKNSERMPALFLGHGSPMNAIEDNEFVRKFKQLGNQLEKPNAILVVSAHWETRGTFVTAMEQPRTIHDFGGFPPALYREQYPAPGSPGLAKEVSELVQPQHTVGLDEQWGLDHGAWTVVKHLFPAADVPVIQLSLDFTRPAAYHYALAQQLKKLRNKGVLIIGSGNIIHNLRRVAWDKLSENYAFDWAIEANDQIKKWLLDGDHQNLIDFKKHGTAFDLAIPTPEHYLPLLYTMALQDKNEELTLFNDKPLGGSLSMTSVKLG